MVFKFYEDMEFFARWYIMFGDHARILEPESLKEKVKEIVEEITRRLNK